MKKFLTLWILMGLTAAASAANMQFITVLSQPVGSFSRLNTTSTAPVYAEKVIVGSAVSFALRGNALINAAKAAEVFINTNAYTLTSLRLQGGELDASSSAVTVNTWTETINKITGSEGTLTVNGNSPIDARAAGFGTLALNGTTFFNGTLSESPTQFRWSADSSPSGSLLLQN